MDWEVARRDMIAEAWRRAIVALGVPDDDPKVALAVFNGWTHRLIAALTAQTWDAMPVMAVGAALADAFDTIRGDVLGISLRTLFCQLTADLSVERLTILWPRLALSFGALADGYLYQARGLAHLPAPPGLFVSKQECQADGLDWEATYKQWEREPLDVERDAELSQMVDSLEQELHDYRQVEKLLQRKNRSLELLNRASRALNSSLNLEQVIVTILEEVRNLLGAAASSVWIVDPATGELVCQEATGLGAGQVRGWRLKAGEGIAGWVVSTGESTLVDDVQMDDHYDRSLAEYLNLEVRSILTVPIYVKSGVIGVVQVLYTEEGAFEGDEQMLLESLVASAAIAMDNADLMDILQKRMDELRVRNEDLDAFSHTVAHDLKAPVSYIVGYAEALIGRHGEIPAEEWDQYLEEMARSGRRIASIVDALLLLAGVRNIMPELEPLDMGEIVAVALRRLELDIEASGAKITVPAIWPVAIGYVPWIEEVWINYIGNAIKYGGPHPRIVLGADYEGETQIRFWVQDDGIGIPLENQPLLFRPFIRLNRSSVKGHGLGLSIVRRIVEKLGGVVGLKSTEGQGSTFYFTLPAGCPSPA